MRRSSRKVSTAHRSAQSGPENSNSVGGSGVGTADNASEPLSPQADLHRRCVEGLKRLEELRLTLGEFLVAVCYGNPESRNHELVVKARRSLYETDCLKTFLDNSYEPPRPPSGGGNRPVAGSKIIRKFAHSLVQTTFCDELSKFSVDYTLSDKELADMDIVAELTSNKLHKKVKETCPMLYKTVTELSGEEVEEEVEKETDSDDEHEGERKLPPGKHPHFASVMQITAFAYRFNRRRNSLQKVMSIYLFGKHTSKAVFDILHQAGFTMSYSYVRKALSNLAQDIHIQIILAASGPIIIFHDNIRMKFAIRSQRGDNQSVSDNGTAISMLVLPGSASIFGDPDRWRPHFRAIREQRLTGTAPRLCWADLSELPRLKRHRSACIYDILDFLRMIPGLAKAKLWGESKLQRPVGPQQLPSGREHRMKQYMLPTANIDESSHTFALKYLELDTGDQKYQLALERMVVWVGDQMTAQRCRQDQSFLQECRNSLTRWDPFLFIFGGFHTMMTLGTAVLETFRGSSVGPTFGGDIVLLSRVGLEKKKGHKRHDFHDVDEFLHHEAEAHFRGIFGMLTGCTTEDEVSHWAETHSAGDLFDMASTIYRNHASSGALTQLKTEDQLRRNAILRARDMLLYYSTRRAFKHGDIDRIEDLLPELLFYFAGSGHPQYAKEVLEFLQLTRHECAPELRAAILKYGLVVNKHGRADGFYPIDQRQEFNNAGIRDYGPPPQNASWEQIAEISPIIPFIQDIVEHVETSITGLKRSHIHKNPKHEKDIRALVDSHSKHKIHIGEAKRTVPKEDQADDCISIGIKALRDRNMLKDFHNKR